MNRSYVVTGGGHGIGRALVERLLADDGSVVAIELDPAALAWTTGHPAGRRVLGPRSLAAGLLAQVVRKPEGEASRVAEDWVGLADAIRASRRRLLTPRPVVKAKDASPFGVSGGCARRRCISGNRAAQPSGLGRRFLPPTGICTDSDPSPWTGSSIGSLTVRSHGAAVAPYRDGANTGRWLRTRPGTAADTKEYGSSWIFERCLTWANVLQRVQRSAFSLGNTSRGGWP
jgi:hypothetical protein